MIFKDIPGLQILKLYESESCSVVSDSWRPHGRYSPWNSPGHNTAVGNLSLLQGIFPTQGSNPDLLHCRWINFDLAFFSLRMGLLWYLSWLRIRLQCGRPGFDPWVGTIPWRRESVPTPVFWPGEFHGLYRGHKESDMTQWLSLTPLGQFFKVELLDPSLKF